MKSGILALAILGLAPSHAALQTDEARAEATELLREAQNTLRTLNRISDALEREPLEPAELVAQVHRRGDDAHELTRWVAERVGWLPYRGALRGPRGLLIERRGNSLDQSLLLAEALRVTGLEVRLAHAVLPLEVAEQMYAVLRSPRPSAVAVDAVPGGQPAEELGRYAERIGADPARLRDEMAAQEIRVQEHLEQVLPMVVGQARDLRQLLDERGVTVSGDSASLRQAEIEALRDHWWVQVADDRARWTDHDPLALQTAVDLTLTPAATYAPESLPDDQRHRLTLRVVVERVAAEGLATEIALTHDAAASSLAGGYFMLGFRPMNPERGGDSTAAGEESGAALLELAVQETEWLPTLVEIDYVGRAHDYHESSVYTDGTLNAEPELETKRRKLGDAISALKSPKVEAGRSDSRLTAVWIEYLIEAPGERPRTIRRALFDLLGEVARRSGAPALETLTASQVTERSLAFAGQTEILPSTCRLSSDFTLRLALATQLKNQRILVDAARIAADGGTPGADLVNSLSAPPFELYALAQERLAIGRHARRVYHGTLNVFSSHFWPFEPTPDLAQRLSVDGVKPSIAFTKAIDIVANGVAVLAPMPGEEAPASAWEIRLEQGVLDTVVEVTSFMNAEVGSDTSAWNGRSLASNPAAWMGRHPVDQWRALRPGDELDAELGDTHVRAAEALAAGQAVVMHGLTLDGSSGDGWRPGCWWRVDVATGETLGIGPRGWGQIGGETVVVQGIPQRILFAVKFFGGRLACFTLAVAARVQVGVLVAGLGEVFGASEGVRWAMAALSQIGYVGAAFTWLQGACRVIVFSL